MSGESAGSHCHSLRRSCEPQPEQSHAHRKSRERPRDPHDVQRQQGRELLARHHAASGTRRPARSRKRRSGTSASPGTPAARAPASPTSSSATSRRATSSTSRDASSTASRRTRRSRLATCTEINVREMLLLAAARAVAAATSTFEAPAPRARARPSKAKKGAGGDFEEFPGRARRRGRRPAVLTGGGARDRPSADGAAGASTRMPVVPPTPSARAARSRRISRSAVRHLFPHPDSSHLRKSVSGPSPDVASARHRHPTGCGLMHRLRIRSLALFVAGFSVAAPLCAQRRAAVRASARGEARTHVVKKGDTLWGLAKAVPRRPVPLARDLPAQHRPDRRPALDLSRRLRSACPHLARPQRPLAATWQPPTPGTAASARRGAAPARPASHDRLQSRGQRRGRAPGTGVAASSGTPATAVRPGEYRASPVRVVGGWPGRRRRARARRRRPPGITMTDGEPADAVPRADVRAPPEGRARERSATSSSSIVSTASSRGREQVLVPTGVIKLVSPATERPVARPAHAEVRGRVRGPGRHGARHAGIKPGVFPAARRVRARDAGDVAELQSRPSREPART